MGKKADDVTIYGDGSYGREHPPTAGEVRFFRRRPAP